MSHTLALGCAGALLLVSQGCVTTGSPNPYGMITPGTDAQVAATLHARLGDAGIWVLVDHVQGEIRLGGKSKAGQIFCIHVKPAKGEGEDRAAVYMIWEREPDPKLWRTVVEILKETDADSHPSPDESGFSPEEAR